MILRFRLNCLANFITILYLFKNHSGQVILLEKPQFIPQKFICLSEIDESFKNEKKYDDKDFCLTIGVELGCVND